MDHERIIGAGRQAIEAAQAGLAAAADALSRLEGRAARSADRLSGEARAAARDLYDEAGQQAETGLRGVRKAARTYGEAGAEAARTYAKQGATLVAERAGSQPFATIVTAAAVGFLLGWTFRG